MSIYCMKVVNVSLGEKDLKEDSTEQGTAKLTGAAVAVGLGGTSGDKKAAYKLALFVVLTVFVQFILFTLIVIAEA